MAKRMWLAVCAIGVLGQGCALLGIKSGPPPKCQKIPVELFVSGSELMNVNSEGQSAPVEIRAFFLKERDIVETLDFDALYQDGKTALKGGFLKETSFTVIPKEEKITTVDLPPTLQYVAIMGVFRTVEGLQWRRIVDVRGAVKACRPDDLHIPIRASVRDNRVIAPERIDPPQGPTFARLVSKEDRD